MTTNSEQVSQTDPNQPSNVDQAIAAGAQAQQQQPAPTETEVVDIDAKDLADAVAAAEAEKAAAAGGGQVEQQQGNQQGQAQQDQQPAGGQQQPAGDTPMIPKPRFDEALERATKAQQDAAYWKGVADARAAGTQQPNPQGGQPGHQQQQQQPTAQDRLAAIHAKQDELAKKFDDGELTFSDMQKQKRELDGQELSIREEVLQARLQPQQSQQQPQGDELYLDTLTGQLEADHPWVNVFDKVGTKNDWDYIKAQALESVVARGIDPNKGAIGKYELRKEVAVLMDKLGPGLLTDRAKAKGVAIPGQQPAQQQQQQQQQQHENLSPEAKARLAKLNLSADAPPNLSRMQGNSNDGTPTDARIDAMSDDDIGNLPDATRKKLLGIMPA